LVKPSWVYERDGELKRLIFRLLVVGVALPGILLTSACETRPAEVTVLSKNELGITLLFKWGVYKGSIKNPVQAVYDKANQHCKSLGKSAIQTVPPSEGGGGFTFECR